jgi:NSS family neurotransmitter:Na+ symporter
VVFFALLFFAALTSAISLLEVVASYFIDERRWPRAKAALMCGGFIALLGVPSALAKGGAALFSSDMIAGPIGKDWLTMLDDLTTQWMLPVGGLLIALFVAWRVGDHARERGFKTSTRFGRMYWGWVFLLRYFVPIGVVAVFLNKIGLI